ncbi:hypothetical protein PR048_031268 [Dryococelus australis]|uniref:Uncharacterized protein n=1 Tax=Dryococelus australis TaxID=614101 RepID=A0ABQ9G8W1_9NEOP|nr:hypothetical protein PR048_031268 [Dryococelus australis]
MRELDMIKPSVSPIEDTLNNLAGSQWFSTFDMKSGYWQREVAPDDQEDTEFCVQGRGTWQFKKVAAANLKQVSKKWYHFQKKINFLGHVVSADGIETDLEKAIAIIRGDAAAAGVPSEETDSTVPTSGIEVPAAFGTIVYSSGLHELRRCAFHDFHCQTKRPNWNPATYTERVIRSATNGDRTFLAKFHVVCVTTVCPLLATHQPTSCWNLAASHGVAWSYQSPGVRARLNLLHAWLGSHLCRSPGLARRPPGSARAPQLPGRGSDPALRLSPLVIDLIPLQSVGCRRQRGAGTKVAAIAVSVEVSPLCRWSHVGGDDASHSACAEDRWSRGEAGKGHASVELLPDLTYMLLANMFACRLTDVQVVAMWVNNIQRADVIGGQTVTGGSSTRFSLLPLPLHCSSYHFLSCSAPTRLPTPLYPSLCLANSRSSRVGKGKGRGEGEGYAPQGCRYLSAQFPANEQFVFNTEERGQYIPQGVRAIRRHPEKRYEAYFYYERKRGGRGEDLNFLHRTEFDSDKLALEAENICFRPYLQRDAKLAFLSISSKHSFAYIGRVDICSLDTIPILIGRNTIWSRRCGMSSDGRMRCRETARCATLTNPTDWQKWCGKENLEFDQLSPSHALVPIWWAAIFLVPYDWQWCGDIDVQEVERGEERDKEKGGVFEPAKVEVSACCDGGGKGN